MNCINFKLDSLTISTYGKCDEKPIAKLVEKSYFTNDLSENFGVSSSDETIMFFLDKNLKGIVKLTRNQSESYDLKTIIEDAIANKGLNPKTTKVYFGPSITFSHCISSRFTLVNHINNGYQICAKRTAKVDYVDLLTLNYSILSDFGFDIKNIFFSDYDTFENENLLYSKERGDKLENITVF